MSGTTIRKVQHLSEHEHDSIVDILLKAYQNEAGVPPMVGGRNELRSLLFSAMIRPGAKYGELYVLEMDQEIISAALWFKPGRMLWSTDEQRSLGFNQLLEKLSDEDRDWWTNTYQEQIGNFLRKLIQVPLNELWWLNILATSPEHQGRGHATKLMEHIMKSVIPTPAYAGMCATSQANEHFYNGLGYLTQGSFTLPSRFDPFTVYAFLRSI